MRHVVVRYELKADRVSEHEALLAKVFAQLREEKPEGLRYEAWKLADGVSFVHLARVSVPGNPLVALSSFKAFTADIADRCVDPPVSSDATVAHSHP